MVLGRIVTELVFIAVWTVSCNLCIKHLPSDFSPVIYFAFSSQKRFSPCPLGRGDEPGRLCPAELLEPIVAIVPRTQNYRGGIFGFGED